MNVIFPIPSHSSVYVQWAMSTDVIGQIAFCGVLCFSTCGNNSAQSEIKVPENLEVPKFCVNTHTHTHTHTHNLSRVYTQKLLNYQHFRNSVFDCFAHFFISPLLLFSRFFIRQSPLPAQYGKVWDCPPFHAITVRNKMIRTLLALPGRCRQAVAFLALVFLLSPAALKAQSGNTVPETAERDSVVMRTTFYFSPGNGEWIERLPEIGAVGALGRGESRCANRHYRLGGRKRTGGAQRYALAATSPHRA